MERTAKLTHGEAVPFAGEIDGPVLEVQFHWEKLVGTARDGLGLLYSLSITWKGAEEPILMNLWPSRWYSGDAVTGKHNHSCFSSNVTLSNRGEGPTGNNLGLGQCLSDNRDGLSET
jgi:hypothetical protein